MPSFKKLLASKPSKTPPRGGKNYGGLLDTGPVSPGTVEARKQRNVVIAVNTSALSQQALGSTEVILSQSSSGDNGEGSRVPGLAKSGSSSSGSSTSQHQDINHFLNQDGIETGMAAAQRRSNQGGNVPIHLTPAPEPSPSRTLDPVDLDNTPPATPHEAGSDFDFSGAMAQSGGVPPSAFPSKDPFLGLQARDQGTPGASRPSPAPLPPPPHSASRRPPAHPRPSPAPKKKTRASQKSPARPRHRQEIVPSSSASLGSVKSMAQMATDSNCIAGEFREILVTLSDESTIDSNDQNNEAARAEIDDSAFGIYSDNPNTLADIGLTDQAGSSMRVDTGGFPDPELTHTFPDDDSTPRQLHTSFSMPHGLKPGSEDKVVLTDSQRKLREKLLNNSARRMQYHGSYEVPSNINANSPSNNSLMSGVTHEAFGHSFSHDFSFEVNEQRERVVIDRSDLPPVNDRARLFGNPSARPPPRPDGVGDGRRGWARSECNYGDNEAQYYETLDREELYRVHGEPPPESSTFYRSHWGFSNSKNVMNSPGTPGSEAGVIYSGSYLNRGAYSNVSAMSSGSGHVRRSTIEGDALISSVFDRVKTNMKAASPSAAPPAPSPSVEPREPRARSASPAPTGNKLRRERRLSRGRDTVAASPPVPKPNTDGLVFGSPDTFGAAAGLKDVEEDGMPSIRERAKAIEGWSGGKGVAVGHILKPTSGYSGDGIYQNAYLRKNSPQVLLKKKFEGEAASPTVKTPQKGQAFGVSRSSSKKKSAMPPAFLSALETWGNEIEDVSSPLSQSDNVKSPTPVQEARRSKKPSKSKENNPPAFLSKVDGLKNESAVGSTSYKEAGLDRPPDDETIDIMFLKGWSNSRGISRSTSSADAGSNDGGESFDDNFAIDNEHFEEPVFG